jgi:hypothetical protein
VHGGGPHRRQGDSGALTNFIEGGWHPVLRAVKGIDRGRGKLSGALEWSEAVGRGKETKGEEGGPVASQEADGEWLGHVERGNLGAWAAA